MLFLASHLFVNSLFNSCIKNENICKYYNNFNYIPLFSEVLLINTLINLTIPKVRNLSYDSFNNIDSSSIYIHNKIPLNILKTYKRFYNLKFNSIICGMICNIIFESSKVDKLHIALNIGYNSKKLYNNKKGYNRFNNSGIIPIIVNRNSLINIIHKYRDYDKKRYQCDSIIKYHISMDPQTIFENIHNDNFTFPKENSFFFYDLPTTIHFPPSLFVFHPINTIYIFFRELVLVETKTDPISILKKGKNKITKRVRICEDLPIITNNKTKKNRK